MARSLAVHMGLVSAFRQSIYLSKHNGLTPTQIAQEWPAAVELQPLECETPRIVAALSRRMRKQLIIMLVLKIVFYAADLANPWLVGLVSLEYVEPSKYYALITATFLGCRFVMFSCQGLGDMTARLCGVAAMSSMTCVLATLVLSHAPQLAHRIVSAVILCGATQALILLR